MRRAQYPIQAKGIVTVTGDGNLCRVVGRGIFFEKKGGALVPTAEKARIIEETEASLGAAQAAVLANYQGLTVGQLNALRGKLREQGVGLKIVKNTLLRRAAQSLGIEGLEPYLKGPTLLAISKEDPAAGARAMAQAAREYPRRLEVKAGILGRDVLDAQSVRELADLPSREVMIARVLGTMMSPIQRMVWVLNAPVTQLARVLDQIREQKEQVGA